MSTPSGQVPPMRNPPAPLPDDARGQVDLDYVDRLVGPLFLSRTPDGGWIYKADALLQFPYAGGIETRVRIFPADATSPRVSCAFILDSGPFHFHAVAKAAALRELAMVAQEAADLLDALDPPATDDPGSEPDDGPHIVPDSAERLQDCTTNGIGAAR